MQKLKRLMNFNLLSAILFAVVLSSCATPARPIGEVCSIVGSPYNVCACVDSDSGEPTRQISIDQCHGYIAISPAYYGELEDWIQELISKVRGFPKASSIRSSLKSGLQITHKLVEDAKSNADFIKANGLRSD